MINTVYTGFETCFGWNHWDPALKVMGVPTKAHPNPRLFGAILKKGDVQMAPKKGRKGRKGERKGEREKVEIGC